MSQDSAATIAIRCKCGTKLKMPAAAAGRRAKCPKCADVFVIPKPKPPTEDQHDLFGDADSLLSELAAQAETAPATPTAPPAEQAGASTVCPNCQATLQPGAVLCVQCGFDARRGKKLKTARSGGSRARKLAVSTGSFLFGCILSGVGALVGAIIWFGLAALTNITWGLIAWGVGVLAGIGMVKGYGKANMQAGLVATCMSILGIIAGKFMIFVYLSYQVVTGNTNNIEIQRAHLVLLMAQESAVEKGIWREADQLNEIERVAPVMAREVMQWSDDEVRDRLAEYRAAAEEWALEELRYVLASHYSAITARAQGLAEFDEARDALYDAEYAHFEGMDRDHLEAETEKLESWASNEKYQDGDYIRDVLIYERAGEAVSAYYAEIEEVYNRRAEAGDNVDNFDFSLPDKKWAEFYQAAAAEIDAIAPEDRVIEVRRIDEELARQEAQYEDDWADDTTEEEAAEMRDKSMNAFWRLMFSPFDALWIFLACSSALKIGTGGEAE